MKAPSLVIAIPKKGSDEADVENEDDGQEAIAHLLDVIKEGKSSEFPDAFRAAVEACAGMD